MIDGQSSNIKNYHVSAVIVGIVAGVPYLLATPKVQPSEQPYAIMAVVQIILFIGGLILAFKHEKKVWMISLMMLCGIQLTVLGRIIYDSISNMTSHHMWPFEFVVSTILCAPVSFVSAYLGYYVHSFVKKRGPTSGTD